MKRLKIVEMSEYIFAVSDERVVDVFPEYYWCNRDNDFYRFSEDMIDDINKGDKPIIAHLPKNNMSELDIPLLPEIVVEDDVEKLINKQISDFTYDLKESTSTYVKQNCEGAIFGLNRLKKIYNSSTKVYSEDDVDKLAKEHKEFLLNSGKDLSHSIQGMFSFMDGYNSSTKVYSEEDLRKAIEYGRALGDMWTAEAKLEQQNYFIQSLKQPKTPKWFVAEMETARIPYGDDGWKTIETGLKTTTNSQGKKVLVGTYEYE